MVCWGESWLIPGAEVLTAEAPEGQGACRMVGELAHDEYTLVMPLGGHVLTTPDHVFLRLPALYFAQTDPVESIDVTLHAPGDIVATSAGATVRGSTATWTDADSVRAEGFAVTARTTASAPGWIVPGVAGVVWGVALALGWRWSRPRLDAAPAAPQPPGKPVAEPATDHVAPSPPPAPVPSPDRPPEDPSVWAPDA